MKRFLFCLLISLVCSCSKFEESDIPYAPVYLELDLRFGDKDLVGIYNHKSITKARTAGEKTGFSGVLVVCGIDNYGNVAYYAFDLCCPHEAKKNIIIEVTMQEKRFARNAELNMISAMGPSTDKGRIAISIKKILHDSSIVRQTGMGCEKLKMRYPAFFYSKYLQKQKFHLPFALANENNATMRK